MHRKELRSPFAQILRPLRPWMTVCLEHLMIQAMMPKIIQVMKHLVVKKVALDMMGVHKSHSHLV